ncbi:MAG: polysaccharide biosynthesis C-terminal domain-containing protein [Planctomycetota bacterium]
MLKNIGSNWAFTVLQILVFFVLVPFIFEQLGFVRYGAWEVIATQAGWLRLLALGLPMATVRHVTKSIAEGRPLEAERIIANSLTLALILTAVSVLIGVGIYFSADRMIIGSERWSLTPEDLRDARQSMVVVILLFASSFALRLPYAIFDAHHNFVWRNIIQMGGLVVRFGLTLWWLGSHPTMLTLATILLLVLVLECATAVVVSARLHHPVRIRLARPERELVGKLMSFGIFAFLINMGTMIAYQLDSYVIGLFMQGPDVTNYAMGNKVYEQFLALVFAVGTVAMPMGTKLHAQKDWEGLRNVFLKWSKICTSLVFLVGGYILILGPEFLQVWLDDYNPIMGQVMQLLMISFFVFLPLYGVGLPMLMAVDKAKGPGLGLLAMGLMNLVLSVVLVGPYGVLGVAMGTVIPNIVFGIVFLHLSCKHMGVPMTEFLQYCLAAPCLVCCCPWPCCSRASSDWKSTASCL